MSINVDTSECTQNFNIFSYVWSMIRTEMESLTERTNKKVSDMKKHIKNVHLLQQAAARKSKRDVWRDDEILISKQLLCFNVNSPLIFFTTKDIIFLCGWMKKSATTQMTKKTTLSSMHAWNTLPKTIFSLLDFYWICTTTANYLFSLISPSRTMMVYGVLCFLMMFLVVFSSLMVFVVVALLCCRRRSRSQSLLSFSSE